MPQGRREHRLRAGDQTRNPNPNPSPNPNQGLTGGAINSMLLNNFLTDALSGVDFAARFKQEPYPYL